MGIENHHAPDVVTLEKGDGNVIDYELVQRQLGEASCESILVVFLLKIDDVCYPF